MLPLIFLPGDLLVMIHQCFNIVLRKSQRGDDPDVHEILFIVIDIEGMLHVGRSHPEPGQKTDSKKVHYQQRDELLLCMHDLSDSISQQSVTISH